MAETEIDGIHALKLWKEIVNEAKQKVVDCAKAYFEAEAEANGDFVKVGASLVLLREAVKELHEYEARFERIKRDMEVEDGE